MLSPPSLPQVQHTWEILLLPYIQYMFEKRSDMPGDLPQPTPLLSRVTVYGICYNFTLIVHNLLTDYVYLGSKIYSPS
ncbi:hypothetical protein Pcinc_031624 [Petrolisthes cinctipes]|uniref:Uncharacterized protein n=1 Tax=Petrolisthes cinctipes TaxID=88211 RepID=A0AAE1K4A2_PETCI|nr:hypothetical protein Pcinc_031624 [Petrolisthes cinctipes]